MISHKTVQERVYGRVGKAKAEEEWQEFIGYLDHPTIPLHTQISQNSEERQHVEWEPAKEKRQYHGDHQTQHVDQSTRVLFQVVRGGQQVHGDSAVAACYDNKRQEESKGVLRKS